jgi:hypothetical protein
MNTHEPELLDLTSDPTSIYYEREEPDPEAEAIAAKASTRGHHELAHLRPGAAVTVSARLLLVGDDE